MINKIHYTPVTHFDGLDKNIKNFTEIEEWFSSQRSIYFVIGVFNEMLSDAIEAETNKM